MNNEIMISRLGVNIRKVRTEKGLSILQLSKLADVGSSTISKIESGKRQTLNSDTLKKIADVLKISPAILLGNEKNTLDHRITSILTLINEINHAPKLELNGKEMTEYERAIVRTHLDSALKLIGLHRELEK